MIKNNNKHYHYKVFNFAKRVMGILQNAGLFHELFMLFFNISALNSFKFQYKYIDTTYESKFKNHDDMTC
jgi:hypothetical protein